MKRENITINIIILISREHIDFNSKIVEICMMFQKKKKEQRAVIGVSHGFGWVTGLEGVV